MSRALPQQITGLYHAGSVGIIMSGWLGAMNYGVIVANEVDSQLNAVRPSKIRVSSSTPFPECSACRGPAMIRQAHPAEKKWLDRVFEPIADAVGEFVQRHAMRVRKMSLRKGRLGYLRAGIHVAAISFCSCDTA